MKTRACLNCDIALSGHFNRKRCEKCSAQSRHRPPTTMTKAQIRKARSLIGNMPREEIAKEIGVSVSNLKRAFRGTRLAFHNYCVAKPDLVRRVNAFYADHGRTETAEKFGLKLKQVEHIVCRYRMNDFRQIRWTESEIIEAARMAGLVSPQAQAKYFKRPNAYVGSIRSLWMKRFKMGGGNLNGMVHWYAKELVTVKARYLKPLGLSRKGKAVEFRRLILWVDMEKCLKPETPEFVREAISTLANFQRWLFDSQDPKRKILRMIKERELPSAERTRRRHGR